MSALSQVNKILKEERITNFTGKEVLYLGPGNSDPYHPGYKLNSLPPDYLIEHCRIPLIALQTARTEVKFPILITSGYRNYAYNASVGSPNPQNPRVLTGTGSYHPRFSAFDFLPADRSKAKLKKLWDTCIKLRKEGRIYIGGLGLYDSFIHIDGGPQRTW